MKKIILAIMIILLTGCSSISKTSVITYNDALKLINDSSATIIDVRTESEYNEGHIEDAILFTLDTINESTAKDKIKAKDSYVIVYCRSGNRSKQAQELLNSLGYTNVYNLGSISNWQG